MQTIHTRRTTRTNQSIILLHFSNQGADHVRCGLVCKWAGSKMMSDRQQAHATVTETKNNKGQEQNRKRRRTVAQLLLTSACRNRWSRGTTVNENRGPFWMMSELQKEHARAAAMVNCFACSANCVSCCRRVSSNLSCRDLSCLNSDGSSWPRAEMS